MLTVGSLFSGIGGFDLGLERAGMRIEWQVERDPFARRVLAARWPHVTCGDDVREGPRHGDEPIDLLVGGFPCQDLSVAGKRAGLAGERSGLFHEFIRIAKTLKPQWGLVENVPGLFSSCGGRDLATVLEGLRECWPVVGYAVLDSQYFGVPQRRRRVFLIGGPTERSVEQVLFECYGGSGDFASSTEAGTHVAASLRSRSHKAGVNQPGRGGEDDMNLVVSDPITCNPYSDKISEENKLICQAITNLASGGPDDNEAQAGHLVMQCHGSNVGPMGHLRAGNGGLTGGVRRLTPTECERLQGFPDGWTCLCQPLAQYDAMRCTCPDGPRYKTLGNAVTVPVLEHLGRMILEVA